jgi:hypothetical protein
MAAPLSGAGRSVQRVSVTSRGASISLKVSSQTFPPNLPEEALRRVE